MSNVKFYLNFPKKKKKKLIGKLCIELDITNVKFYHNSILLKLSSKNKGILLNNFKTKTFCYIVFKLGINTHFGHVIAIISSYKRNYGEKINDKILAKVYTA